MDSNGGAFVLRLALRVSRVVPDMRSHCIINIHVISGANRTTHIEGWIRSETYQNSVGSMDEHMDMDITTSLVFENDLQGGLVMF